MREGTSVWLNPLMLAYWFFDLQSVFARHLFAATLSQVKTFPELVEAIQTARRKTKIEERAEIPI